MKIVHVLKRIEMIDNDIKELKKLEKSVSRNKSFSTPIYISIEKQINIMLGERIKLLELKIENPPTYLVEEIEGGSKEAAELKPMPEKKAKPGKQKKQAELEDDDDIPMLTQDQIDEKFSAIKAETEKKRPDKTKEEKKADEDKDSSSSDSVKLLDIALQKGTLSTPDPEKERKVRFFRDNFPLD